MDFWIYDADVYCSDCVEKIIKNIKKENGGKFPVDWKDETSYDSSEFPKGPFDNEAGDSPQHCGSCQVFLEQPLTTHGYDYTRQLILENPDGPGSKQWLEFYGDDVRPMEEDDEDN